MDSQPKFGERGEWYVVAQFVLFGLIFVAPFVTRPWLTWPDSWTITARIVGIGLLGIGLLLALAGVLSLGDSLTAVPRPKEGARMVESGAYRLVRHPIYSGVILGAWGWGFFMTSGIALLLALLLFFFFDVKSRREEKWLAETYENYPDYQQRVRKLIPFLY